MSAAASANNSRLISRTLAREAVRHALRLYVGRGRRFTVKQLSNATGVPDRLIESATCDPETGDFRELCVSDLLSITSFLGETFTTEWLRLARQGAFALPEDDLPSPGEIVAECAEDTSEVADAARDGRFDGADRAALREVGLREVGRGMKLVAAGGRA